MAKTLYSLMLNEEIVREVDRMAHRMGATRSGLINSILAEYVGYKTPEQRINEILAEVERMLAPANDLVPFLAPNAMSLSLKSSLEYKYRPTVKYEVSLFGGENDPIGEISVVFRTQSAALLSAMAEFFRSWKQLEDGILPAAGIRVEYALYDGRFTRSIAAPARETAPETLAGAISAYLQLFDRCMKNYVTGRYGRRELELEYARHLHENPILI